MSHEVYENKIAVVGDPAWHRLGHNYPHGEIVSAVRALNEHVDYDVRWEKVCFPDGTPIENRQVIYRPADPTKGEVKPVIFGVVSEGYVPVTPRMTAETFDAAVRGDDGQPYGIETIGALRDGKIFFITSTLPEFTIDGDRVNSYLLLENDMRGQGGITVNVVNVRVVCQNTLFAAKSAAQLSQSITHGRDVIDDLSAWLSFLHERVMNRRSVIKAAYEIMAQTPVSAQQIEWFGQTVYTAGPEPVADDMPASIYKKSFNRWLTRDRYFEAARDQLAIRWEGAALGYDVVDRKPRSAWDLWQVQTEIENHWTPRYQAPDVMAASVMVGDRRNRIEAGFDAAWQLTGEAMAEVAD